MGENIINAVTKNRKSEDSIYEMTKRALSMDTLTDFSVKELAGGLCNAVYLVMANGRKMVLKVASDDSVVVMRHEKDYVPVEARMLKLFQERIDILSPKLIYFDDSFEICDVPYFFMTYLDGKSLMTLDEKERPNDVQLGNIKYQLGEICRAICSIKTEYFGVPAMPETYCDNNCDFMLTIIQMLLEDAKDKKIILPENISYEDVVAIVEAYRAELEEVKEPCIVHTDTWDGNLLVKDGAFAGLVDYAAMYYGDPLLTHDFHDFSPEPGKDFCAGFGKESFTENEKIRIVIYQLWQRLGMIVECGFRDYEDPNQYSWVHGEFVKSYQRLCDLQKNKK